MKKQISYSASIQVYGTIDEICDTLKDLIREMKDVKGKKDECAAMCNSVGVGWEDEDGNEILDATIEKIND
jgi:hypothetical protein